MTNIRYVQTMHCSVSTGVVILQWPADITAEDLEDAAEAIEHQVRTLRRIVGERERPKEETT